MVCIKPTKTHKPLTLPEDTSYTCNSCHLLAYQKPTLRQVIVLKRKGEKSWFLSSQKLFNIQNRYSRPSSPDCMAIPRPTNLLQQTANISFLPGHLSCCPQEINFYAAHRQAVPLCSIIDQLDQISQLLGITDKSSTSAVLQPSRESCVFSTFSFWRARGHSFWVWILWVLYFFLSLIPFRRKGEWKLF